MPPTVSLRQRIVTIMTLLHRRIRRDGKRKKGTGHLIHKKLGRRWGSIFKKDENNKSNKGRKGKIKPRRKVNVNICTRRRRRGKQRERNHPAEGNAQDMSLQQVSPTRRDIRSSPSPLFVPLFPAAHFLRHILSPIRLPSFFSPTHV